MVRNVLTLELPTLLLGVVALVAVIVALVGQSRVTRVKRSTNVTVADATGQTDQLRLREELFRALVSSSSDIVTLVDSDGRVRYQSNAVEPLLGERSTGASVEQLVHPDDRVVLLGNLDPLRLASGALSVEIRLEMPDRTFRLTETTITNQLHHPAIAGFVLSSRDITERKELEAQLRYRAFTDALTGLGNRAHFRDELERAVTRAKRYNSSLAVCFIDLDGFKLVNDTLGHDAGDRFLVEVSARIRSRLRGSDIVARMGGDEFAVLLENSEDVRIASAVAGRVLASLQTPIEIDGALTRTSASIGVDVTGGRNATSAEELLRNADLAMYRAKTTGKNKVEMYEARLRDAALSRVRLERELRQAIVDDDLVLHYQPIVSIPSGIVTGVEALVRWNHPSRGLIPPSEFVPVAEDSGLIVELGRWALRRACIDIATISPGGNGITVAVNVATRQLLQPGLLQAVKAAIGGSGLEPDRLVLEITEGALLDDSRATASLLSQLREQGARLAIDDFGTGYSSLSRLRSFPVDKLKIDRSFIQEITRANERAPIVAAIMAMAHSLGLTAVAEGVETVEQLACLHQYGCEEIQGFLLSRPLTLDQLERLLREERGMLAQAELEPTDRRASGLDQLVSVAAHDDRPVEDRSLPLLAELCRQTGVAGAYLARVDRRNRVERVVQAHMTGSVSVPIGMEITSTDLVGIYRIEDGARVQAALVSCGVQSLAVVPVLPGEGPVEYVLGLVSSQPTTLDSQSIVLAELFTRLLADIAASPTSGTRASADTLA